MNKPYLSASIALLAVAPVFAQEDAPAAKKSVRITIKSNSEVTQERQILVDGEEMGFGRGRGGGSNSPVKTSTTIVLDEGANWRNYITAEAKQTRAGRNGEPRESVVKSALEGKNLMFVEKDGKTVTIDGVFDGGAVDERTMRGISTKIDVAALIPEGDLTAGSEVKFGAAFRKAMASLVHPIRAERATEEGRSRRGGEEGQGGQRRRGGEEGQGGGQRRRGGDEGGQRRRRGGEEGQGGQPRRGGEEGEGGQQRRRRGGEEGGGQGGQRGGRGQGGRGQGGRGGRFQRGTRQVNDAAFRLLANDKLDWTGTGKVVSVEEGTAKIDFSIEVKGEGDLKELGLDTGNQMRRMMGRRRGGGGQGGQGGGQGGGEAPEATGEGQATMTLTGTILANAQTRQLKKLTIKGKARSVTDSVMMRSMRGEEVEIETHQETDGSLSLEVTCEPSPSKK